ncbi:T-lymphocyte activation antigen CD86 isoform X2 [Grammomys surdaster]|nr:T-lymphocyte activation antigen CD86 isoform X2 [Grammomys surdaster]
MDLRLLFVTAIVFTVAVSMKRQAYFNRTAYLPCPFTKAQNISLSELVVFWQDRNKLVLYEHYLGTEKPDNVNAKYRGRTSFDGETWALRLHNVQIKDMGSYDCFIQRKTPTGSIILQQTETELSVIANFSKPEIELAQNITRHSGINLTCSSKQGYPKPKKMYFRITNSTNEYGDNMQISQDNVTELFSVSISLSRSFPDGVNNMTIECILETESITISSKPYNIAPPGHQHPQKNRIEIVLAVVFVVIFILMFFILAKKYYKKQNQANRPRRTTSALEPESSAGNESINLEEFESQIASAKPNAE